MVLDFPFLLIFVAGLSIAVVPLLRARINKQFLLGARNELMASYLLAGFSTRSSPTPTTPSPVRSSR